MRRNMTGVLVVFIGSMVVVQPVRAELPRVLIIGDSISIGYDEPVREMLAGEAEVVHNPGNAGPTWRGLENIDQWLGTGHWNVIHFNWGLHDLVYRKDGKPDLTALRASTLEQYKANLEKLVDRLEKTGAMLIWATGTLTIGNMPGPSSYMYATYMAYEYTLMLMWLCVAFRQRCAAQHRK